MREATTSNDPLQQACWWMYRSSTMSPLPDIHRVASRAEHVSDVVVALAATVNNTYWERCIPKSCWGLEGDKEIPIDVEKLSDVGDLEAVGVTVKKEFQDEEEELSEKKCKNPIPVKVRRSERLKKMQE
ncbi:hypothetical protein ZWY2020_057474 [Hordeum vulgare]|nr:hypothetical protein ZWY2020_057474 [Hordeum vulgare]